jgi:hypothetical protein
LAALSTQTFEADGIVECLSVFAIDTASKSWVPWKSVAAWTHQLPTNPTDLWMDAAGRDQFYHRYANHSPFDLFKVLGHQDLKAIDFGKHLLLDVITIQGIPIFPEQIIRGLARILETNIHTIAPWVQFNIFDIALGAYLNVAAIKSLNAALIGELPWNLDTAIRTFGVGSLEIAGGISAKNPMWIIAGTVDVSAGSVAMYKHYSQPLLWGIPVVDIARSTAIGAAVGIGVCALIECAIKEKPLSAKVYNVAKSGVLSALSSAAIRVLPWSSLPLMLSSSSYQLAKIAAKNRQESIRQLAPEKSITDIFKNRKTKMNSEKSKYETALIVKKEITEFFLQFDSAPDYVSLQFKLNECKKIILDREGVISSEFNVAAALAASLLNPDEVGRKVDIGKLIGLLGTSFGGLGVFLGAFSAGTINAGLVASLSAFVLGPAVPIAGPAVMAVGFATMTYSIYKLVSGHSREQAAARALTGLINAVDSWATRNDSEAVQVKVKNRFESVLSPIASVFVRSSSTAS